MHVFIADGILRIVVTDVEERCVVEIDRNVLLTGDTPSEAEFEVREPADVAEELLVLQFPAECQGGEGAPAVVLVEAGRTVPAHREGGEVAVVEGVVHTSEVGKQGVAGSISRGGASFRIFFYFQIGVPAATFTKSVVVEVLCFRTSHDIHVVFAEEVLILRVDVALEVVFVLSIAPSASKVVVGSGIGRDFSSFVTFTVVSANVGVDVEVFKTVNLVVQFQVTNQRGALGVVILQFQHGERVGSVLGVGLSRPRGVAEGGTVRHVLIVASGELAVGIAFFKIDGLRRVHGQGCANGTLVSIAVLRCHVLGIEVHAEVVVEEGRREIDGGSETFKAAGLERTFIVGVAEADAIGQEAQAAVDGEIVVVADGSLVDFVLPVGVGSAKRQGGCAAEAFLHHLTEFVAAEDVKLLGKRSDADTTVVGDLRTAVLAAFLGGDDDDTVGSARTVDGSGGSILQDGEAGDVFRIDHCQGVGKTLHAFVVHGETVDDDERVVGGVERRTTADADGSVGTRRTTRGGDIDTGNLTNEHVLRIGRDALGHFVGFDGGHRTGGVCLLHFGVADHHRLVEGGVVFKCDDNGAVGFHVGHFVADVAHANHRAGLHVEAEVTVHVGLCGCLRAGHGDSGKHHGLTGFVLHMSLHLQGLSRGAE